MRFNTRIFFYITFIKKFITIVTKQSLLLSWSSILSSFSSSSETNLLYKLAFILYKYFGIGIFQLFLKSCYALRFQFQYFSVSLNHKVVCFSQFLLRFQNSVFRLSGFNSSFCPVVISLKNFTPSYFYIVWR